MQMDLFAATVPPDKPIVLRVELGGHSYGQIVVAILDDGTWGFGTDDQFQGFCGHGSPVWPKAEGFPEARDAIVVALDKLHDKWTRLAVDQSSCCSDKHRTAARKGLDWIADQYAAFGLDPEPERAAA